MSEAAALPGTSSALQKLAAASTFENEVRTSLLRSRTIAWRVAGVATVAALLAAASTVLVAYRPTPAPGLVMVDRLTGESVMVPQLTRQTVPQLVALDQHQAVQYVRAREAYNFNFLRRDYDQVARSSTPEVFNPYRLRFTGEEAMQTRIGDREEHRVTVLNARPSATTVGGRAGEIIVTYEREVRPKSGPTPPKTSYIATVMYEYRPEALERDIDRLENPLGFVVTNYRVEAELASSVPGARSAP